LVLITDAGDVGYPRRPTPTNRRTLQAYRFSPKRASSSSAEKLGTIQNVCRKATCEKHRRRWVVFQRGERCCGAIAHCTCVTQSIQAAVGGAAVTETPRPIARRELDSVTPARDHRRRRAEACFVGYVRAAPCAIYTNTRTSASPSGRFRLSHRGWMWNCWRVRHSKRRVAHAVLSLPLMPDLGFRGFGWCSRPMLVFAVHHSALTSGMGQEPAAESGLPCRRRDRRSSATAAILTRADVQPALCCSSCACLCLRPSRREHSVS